MPKLTINQAIAKQAEARNRYADAAREFRDAYAEHAALDQMLGSRGHDHRGFGEMPPAMLLRHAIAVPDESGSLQEARLRVIEHPAIIREAQTARATTLRAIAEAPNALGISMARRLLACHVSQERPG